LEINYNNINSHSYNNSSFSLNINEKLSKKVKEIKLPNSFGIYIVYKNQKSYENIIYIGKAGEIKNDGTLKNQGLLKRLTNVRNNKTANNYFKELFCDNIDEIIIEYFETADGIIPSFVEASLVQEYFSKFLRLPLLNKSY
jgi:hypothetical protein